jgi:hypothetical protein
MHKIVYKFKMAKLLHGLKNYKVKKLLYIFLCVMGLSLTAIGLLSEMDNSIVFWLGIFFSSLFGLTYITILAMINYGYIHGEYYK